jgi:hypothetical protein
MAAFFILVLCAILLVVLWIFVGEKVETYRRTQSEHLMRQSDLREKERERELVPNQNLLATGEPAEALVVGAEETGMVCWEKPVIRLILEVRRSSDNSYRSDQSPYRVETNALVSALKFPQVQPGSIIEVRLNLSNPSMVAVVLR